MKIKSVTLAIFSLSALAVATSNAAVLAGWDVGAIDLDGATAPNTTPYTFGGPLGTNIASANLTLSTSVNPTTTAGQYGFKVSGGSQQSTLSGAITANHFLQFTLTASVGFVLILTDIQFNGQSSSTGATKAAILSSIGGFTNGNELDSVSSIAGVTGGLDTDSSGFGAPIDLSDPSYQGITTITFRIYGWGTTDGAGATYLRNLTGNDLVINGTTAAAPAPEPSTAFLGALGALVLLRRRR